MINQAYFGDCREGLRKMAEAGVKVQTCVTSPPYFGLRDYGHEGQIGLEDRAPEYVRTLVEVFSLVGNVLADDGTLWVNIGDTYAGYKDGKFPPHSQSGGNQRGMPETGAPHRSKRLLQLDGFKDKELMGIPWRFAFAMREAGWLLRQEIIWAKPNYTPEKVRDRCVRSHEKLFLFTKHPSYFFDGEAIRVAAGNGETKLRPDVWAVPASSYKGAHFATFPPALVEPCILAGSRPGDIVLDPFMGSGTTAAVAVEHGRQFVGCELNEEYGKLINERVAAARTKVAAQSIIKGFRRRPARKQVAGQSELFGSAP